MKVLLLYHKLGSSTRSTIPHFTHRRVSRCFMEGVFDIRSTPLLLGDRVDTGGTTKHGKWSYGSAQVIGVHIRIRMRSYLWQTDQDMKLNSQALLWLFHCMEVRGQLKIFLTSKFLVVTLLRIYLNIHSQIGHHISWSIGCHVISEQVVSLSRSQEPGGLYHPAESVNCFQWARWPLCGDGWGKVSRCSRGTKRNAWECAVRGTGRGREGA